MRPMLLLSLLAMTFVTIACGTDTLDLRSGHAPSENAPESAALAGRPPRPIPLPPPPPPSAGVESEWEPTELGIPPHCLAWLATLDPDEPIDMDVNDPEYVTVLMPCSSHIGEVAACRAQLAEDEKSAAFMTSTPAAPTTVALSAITWTFPTGGKANFADPTTSATTKNEWKFVVCGRGKDLWPWFRTGQYVRYVEVVSDTEAKVTLKIERPGVSKVMAEGTLSLTGQITPTFVETPTLKDIAGNVVKIEEREIKRFQSDLKSKLMYPALEYNPCSRKFAVKPDNRSSVVEICPKAVTAIRGAYQRQADIYQGNGRSAKLVGLVTLGAADPASSKYVGTVAGTYKVRCKTISLNPGATGDPQLFPAVSAELELGSFWAPICP